MDELIQLAVEALSAAKQKSQTEQQPGYAPGSRYGKMLADLQARANQPVAPIVPPVLAPNAPVAPRPAAAARPDAQDFRSTAPAAAPKDTAHDKEEANLRRKRIGGSGSLSGLFETGNDLLRAVVAAEVIAPPIALRENLHWQIRRPNERSS